MSDVTAEQAASVLESEIGRRYLAFAEMAFIREAALKDAVINESLPPQVVMHNGRLQIVASSVIGGAIYDWAEIVEDIKP